VKKLCVIQAGLLGEKEWKKFGLRRIPPGSGRGSRVRRGVSV